MIKSINLQITELEKQCSWKHNFKALVRYKFKREKRICELYSYFTGRSLNLKTPRTYNEKLQWIKCFYYNPQWVVCANKYLMRDYVIRKGYGDILIPLYGVYKSYSELSLRKLPSQFVLKIANSSGSNLLVENKDALELSRLKSILKKLQKEKYYAFFLEWVYKSYPYILCEKLLTYDENNFDYKFLCINGKVQLFQVSSSLGDCPQNVTFNRTGERLKCTYGWDDANYNIKLNPKWEKMLEIAEILSSDFPQVRIDFVVSDGKIYLTEFTFFPTSGYDLFEPDSVDLELGQLLDLNELNGARDNR